MLRHNPKVQFYKHKKLTNNYEIPGFDLFFINPHADTVRNWVYTLFKQDGEMPDGLPREKIVVSKEIYERFIKANLMLLDGFSYPSVNEKTLFFLNVFMHYFIFYDDYVEDDNTTYDMIKSKNNLHFQLLSQAPNTTRTTVPDDDYLSRICDYLGKYFLGLDAKYQGFLNILKNNYYNGCLLQKMHLNNTLTSFNTRKNFEELRQKTSGVFEVFSLACAVHNIVLTKKDWKKVKPLLKYTHDIICFTNDFFSYEKEKNDNNARFSNFIRFQIFYRQAAEEKAIQRTIDLIHCCYEGFVSHISHGEYNDKQRNMIDFMIEFISGNLHLSMFSRRYQASLRNIHNPNNQLDQLDRIQDLISYTCPRKIATKTIFTTIIHYLSFFNDKNAMFLFIVFPELFVVNFLNHHLSFSQKIQNFFSGFMIGILALLSFNISNSVTDKQAISNLSNNEVRSRSKKHDCIAAILLYTLVATRLFTENVFGVLLMNFAIHIYFSHLDKLFILKELFAAYTAMYLNIYNIGFFSRKQADFKFDPYGSLAKNCLLYSFLIPIQDLADTEGDKVEDRLTLILWFERNYGKEVGNYYFRLLMGSLFFIHSILLARHATSWGLRQTISIIELIINIQCSVYFFNTAHQINQNTNSIEKLKSSDKDRYILYQSSSVLWTIKSAIDYVSLQNAQPH